MDIPLRILVVEESETDSILALKALHSNGYHQMYKRVDTPKELILALKDGPWDIIIVDINIKQFDELAVLKMVKESGLDVPCLILSEKIDGKRHVRTIKDGIHDYINEDNLNLLIPSVRSEVHDVLLNNLHKVLDKDNRDQKEWFRVTLASIGDAVITTDTNSIVTYMNPVAEQITGYTQE